MKKKLLLYLVVIVLVAGTSCAGKAYFTKEMRANLHQNQLKENEVQYFNSGKIVLTRNLSYAETQIARGTIRYENGQYIEEIIIPKNTPGVAVDQSKDNMSISFETGENRQLTFKCNTDGYYQLSALSWKDNYGQVKYDTTMYYLTPASSKALLMVGKDYVNKFEKQKRVLKGRTVSSGHE
ncbi:MAG: hypothetical protein Q8O72_00760 [Bacteroidales bacterium]|jgi:hypothetical protein|nr:hypothetical protein [Bacteroidales bacterium]